MYLISNQVSRSWKIESTNFAFSTVTVKILGLQPVVFVQLFPCDSDPQPLWDSCTKKGRGAVGAVIKPQSTSAKRIKSQHCASKGLLLPYFKSDFKSDFSWKRFLVVWGFFSLPFVWLVVWEFFSFFLLFVFHWCFSVLLLVFVCWFGFCLWFFLLNLFKERKTAIRRWECCTSHQPSFFYLHQIL